MIKHLVPAIMLTVLMTLLTGLAYPLAMTGLAGRLFPYKANGSLIERDEKIIGSELIGQNFTGDGYFHGRKETEALLQGLEIIPRRIVAYKGHTLAEMDLDAILARPPALVLVDELAHSNAPESRHPKRYMDVEELLAAGIDVYTTLNIQHVESLNDIVAGITKIRVRETVPDSIIDLACASH